jgi:cytochrome P450
MVLDTEVIMLVVGVGYEFGIGRLMQYLPIPGIGSVNRIFDRMQKASNEAAVIARASENHGARTIFNQMYPEDGSQPLSDSVIAQEAGQNIVAGSDTTLAAIAYIIYCVLRTPEVKKKLLAELATCSPRPGWEELEGKKYLNWVIDEGMRLYPPVPSSLPRKVPAGGATLGGYTFPAGTVVSCQALTMHHDPDVFPNPEKFIPDRWEKVAGPMRDHLMPFGGSMRCKPTCPV